MKDEENQQQQPQPQRQRHFWFNFHLHFQFPRLGNGKEAMPPKGHVAIRVGVEGEEPKRFVVPVEHLSHPLFVELLKEAEEEYGFEQRGSIVIPCNVDYFRHVESIIDRDIDATGGHHHHHRHHYYHLPHFVLCFRA